MMYEGSENIWRFYNNAILHNCLTDFTKQSILNPPLSFYVAKNIERMIKNCCNIPTLLEYIMQFQ